MGTNILLGNAFENSPDDNQKTRKRKLAETFVDVKLHCKRQSQYFASIRKQFP